MIYDLRSPYDKQKFKEKVNMLFDEGAVVEVIKKNPKRSLQQNAYLHVLLGYFASEFGYTLEEVKYDIFKRKCNKDLFEHQRLNKRGVMTTYIRSSAELDTAQMTTAIERFRNYSAAVCGLYLPEPHEHEAILFAQKQMELYKEYM